MSNVKHLKPSLDPEPNPEHRGLEELLQAGVPPPTGVKKLAVEAGELLTSSPLGAAQPAPQK
jgi:hypothetical protein